ncbi:MAG: hypothetical protein HKO59_17370 [Phycisphaerales bacterium]|nr:hypothetical protein [Phycisphaerae bacterium]NNF44350.1 hypothetical protein [Phycisphaerales bacterium]NNM27718.1 hypothetical protein [Phycisphaerales bacterium]
MSYSSPLAGPGVMLFSAALFAYFGFFTAFPEIDVATKDPIPLVLTLKWTLRATAVGFAIAAGLVVVTPFGANLLYGIVGLAAAVAFLVVAGWDLRSDYDSGIHPVLLLAFAGWNGVGSWTGLRTLLGGRGRGHPPEPGI